jgi:hypothetical protein
MLLLFSRFGERLIKSRHYLLRSSKERREVIV